MTSTLSLGLDTLGTGARRVRNGLEVPVAICFGSDGPVDLGDSTVTTAEGIGDLLAK